MCLFQKKLRFMKFTKTKINGCFIIKNNPKYDKRGSFTRNFCQNLYLKKNINFSVKQSNISENIKKGTFRGFHYQKKPFTENKIINCVSGAIFNVVIDLRKNSKSFKKMLVQKISSKNKLSIYIPAGCANGFLTLENNTYIQYLMSDFFEKNKNSYSGIRFDDKIFRKIRWPIKPKIISKKDLSYSNF